MVPPKCKPMPTPNHYRKKAIRSIKHDGDSLRIDIQGEDFSFATLVFRRPAGFRVLDERDLCEFWDEYGQDKGWLYEVECGGWMELEKQRALFNSPDVFDGLREYFVVDEWCVSVLCQTPPELDERGRVPREAEPTRD
jgi:hypothetical protein